VKLLFDSNLSPDLVRLLADIYPGSAHVLFVGLGPAPADDDIWAYAAANDFVVVSKDADFYRLSIVNGAPPKVVWLRTGNGPTSAAEARLRASVRQVSDFIFDASAALLVVGRGL
jgi:predicted nuclease of predicted toxin-antitoxin system